MALRKILMTDDPALVRVLQGSFLNRADFRVVTTGAAQAADRARRERPDLILLVARGADDAAIEACREIKSDEAQRKVAVLMITEDSQHSRCLAAGADAVLAFPPSREHVVERVRTLLPGSVRAAKRRSATVKVAYFRDNEERLGYSKDLGAAGIFLRTEDALSPGDRVQVIFELPTGERPTIRAEGEVVRRVDPDRDSHLISGVGLRFRRLGSRDRAALSRYVGEGS